MEDIFNLDSINFEEVEGTAEIIGDVIVPEEVITEPVEVVVEPTEAADYLSAIASSWKTSGLLPDDFTPPKTVEEFKKSLMDTIYTPLKEAAELEIEAYKESLKEEQGIDEVTLTIAANIAKGVSPETARGTLAISALDELDIESDTDEAYENRANLIRTMHKYQNIDDETSQALIEKFQDSDTDTKKAKDAKAFLKAKVEERLKQEASAFEESKKAQKKVADEFNQAVKTAIDSDLIQEGINKDKLYNDLYTPSKIISIDVDGKEKKIKATPWFAKLNEYGVTIAPQNIENLRGDKLVNFLNLAHYILYGENKKAVKETVKNQVEDELEKLLKTKTPTQKDGDFVLEGVQQFLEI